MHKKIGNNEIALNLYKKSLHIKKWIVGESHIILCGTYNNIGSVYMMNRKFD